MATDDDKREEGQGASDPQEISDDFAIFWLAAKVAGIWLFFCSIHIFAPVPPLWSWILLGLTVCLTVLCVFGSATIRRLAVLLIFIGIIFLLLWKALIWYAGQFAG